ncbi:hypothetical protein EON65_09685 [archaeon]|nr:MAG: hypothetical protein EON65_09685 [archaeon]
MLNPSMTYIDKVLICPYHAGLGVPGVTAWCEKDTVCLAVWQQGRWFQLCSNHTYYANILAISPDEYTSNFRIGRLALSSKVMSQDIISPSLECMMTF